MISEDGKDAVQLSQDNTLISRENKMKLQHNLAKLWIDCLNQIICEKGTNPSKLNCLHFV